MLVEDSFIVNFILSPVGDFIFILRLKRCGCKPTFDNYSPHITIITPIDKSLADLNVKIGNTKLQDKLVLQFSNQTVDILKL